MRVISGEKRGLKLFSPVDFDVRPTTDKVKESIFNILFDIDKSSIVLDLFSGSGAMGIEFLSRGAKMCYFCDLSKKSIEITRKNLIKSDFLKSSVILNYDYFASLEYFFEKNIKFDYIFLDPPYATNYISETLKFILSKNILNKKGLIILETDKNLQIEGFKVIKEKKYSKTIVLFLEGV